MNHTSHLLRILFWLLVALLLGAAAIVVEGQTLPDRSTDFQTLPDRPTDFQPLPDRPTHLQPKTHHRLFWALVALDAGIRSVDVYSTHRMLVNGNREILLATAIASRPAAMAAVEGVDVVAVAWGAWKIHRARWLPLADACVDAPWAIHNLFLPTKPQGAN